jgi:hypothetical protein
MFTFSNRPLWVCAALAVAALTCCPAAAELPRHVEVANFGPEGQDFLQDEFTDIGYGEAIAIRNGIGFVGIPRARDNGHVAVLNLTANGWKRVGTLQAPNSAAETAFGRSIIFRDGLVVIGGARAAYVFKRRDGVWRHVQKLTPPAADGAHDFPAALRYEDGTLLATAHTHALSSVVYVFELNATGTFVRRATLRPSDGAPGNVFGNTISMTRTTFVVGSPSGNLQGDLPGSAYVFRRNSSGRWVQTQKLLPVEPAASFGVAVAIDQGMILVGAPHVDGEGAPIFPDTPDGHVAEGTVFGFLQVAGRYVESFKLRPRPDERFEYQEFGSAIAMFGQRIAISATGPGLVISAFPDGLVFTYTRDGSSVIARGLAAEDGQFVITALGLANNWLLVGANDDFTCPFGCIGAAHIYDVNRFRQ